MIVLSKNIKIDIELINNIIEAINDMEDDSSVQSWVPIRLSSLIMSSGNKLLLDKLDNKMYYY